MTTAPEPTAWRPHRPPPAAILLVPVAVALVLTLFAWPNARLEPRDLPVGVAGPSVTARAIEQRLAARDRAFDVRRYPDEAAARRAIEDRDIYGAFVATASGANVLTASAASQAVAQLLERAASETRGRARAGAVEVQDVVSAPRGAALASSVLPLVLAGILVGAAAALLAFGGLGRVGLVVAGTVLSGLVATAIVQGWLEVVEGDWLANVAALSLTVLATASVVAGLYALLGAPGAIVAALAMVLVGNPFSGVGSAPELLPEPVGAIGQLMPPGAGGNLLRSTGYFDGAAAGGHVAVLVAWTLAGLAVLLAAGARVRRPATEGPPNPDFVTQARTARVTPPGAERYAGRSSSSRSWPADSEHRPMAQTNQAWDWGVELRDEERSELDLLRRTVEQLRTQLDQAHDSLRTCRQRQQDASQALRQLDEVRPWRRRRVRKALRDRQLL